jgi:CheY-like chemotaxis protein
MVHGLTAQSGGGMRISSRVGLGTTVELWLPIAKGSESARPAPKVIAALGATKTSCVLIVDDEPLVATATADMLDDLGYAVLTASSGAQALELIRAEAGIKLVLTDYAMPGMNGAELIKLIRQTKPELPVILVTGYADLPAGDYPKVVRLAKPYRQEELAKELSTLLVREPVAKVVSIKSARREVG